MMTKGKLCLYYLANGTILFSEEAELRGMPSLDSTGEMCIYAFYAKKTLAITAVQQGRQVDLQAAKLSDGMLMPEIALVPISAISMITDCASDEKLTKFRSALAGLVMPGKN